MGVIQMYECDGGCGAREQGGADFTKPPSGWRAFVVQGYTLFACSVACGIMAAQKKVELIFKHKAD